MRLDLFKTLWGAVGSGARYRTFSDAIPSIAAEGFDGVAFALIAREFDPDIGTLEELRDLCDEYELGTVTLVQTAGDTVAEHLQELRRQIEQASPLENRHLICHSGMDAFSWEETAAFFSEALAIEADSGIDIAHETHRHRILYNPWTTARVLDRFEDLKLALDLSHWVVVAERLIDDQIEIIREAGSRAIHIDARVGHAEGPQVPDPRAPEWADTVEAHLGWWSVVWDEQQRVGRDSSLVVPEFGPPPYQQTLPFTGVPTADLWDICRWMGDVLRSRFEARSAP